MLKDRMEKVKANGISVRFIMGMGEGIIDVAENEHVDLIVIGSRELKREKEYADGMLKLLGSVARRVSESAGMLRCKRANRNVTIAEDTLRCKRANTDDIEENELQIINRLLTAIKKQKRKLGPSPRDLK